MRNKIKRILITWDGLWSIPLAAIILMMISSGILYFNPYADVIGIGLVQDVFTAGFRTIVGNTIAQVGIAINLFLFFGYTISDFKSQFQSLNPCVKVSLVFGLYAFYILAFAVSLP